jgi:hypothetical protein
VQWECSMQVSVCVTVFVAVLTCGLLKRNAVQSGSVVPTNANLKMEAAQPSEMLVTSHNTVMFMSAPTLNLDTR